MFYICLLSSGIYLLFTLILLRNILQVLLFLYNKVIAPWEEFISLGHPVSRCSGYVLYRSVIDFDEMAAGLNKRRMIQSAVFKELVKVWHPHSLTFLCISCFYWSSTWLTRLCDFMVAFHSESVIQCFGSMDWHQKMPPSDVLNNSASAVTRWKKTFWEQLLLN